MNSGRQLTEDEKKRLIDHIRTTTDKVKVLKIMGMWFIDKRDGMMKYRLSWYCSNGTRSNFYRKA
ncbi:hypothetical protein [Chryseobacterium indoltheticum]|uniref:hypothetical protein n=1 Tax=Chryseobacterium indoltheticum TaxID=254 RepID=UPI003F4973BC